MNIRYISLGGDNIGSSRLRCHRPLARLPVDMQARCLQQISDIAAADVLFVQKVADRFTQEAAVAAQGRGVPVVYDVDDDVSAEQIALARKANAVLVDCLGRQEYMQGLYQVSSQVLQPSIDYIEERPRVRIPTGRSVVTFGNPHSVEAAMPLLREMHAAGIPCMVIGDPAHRHISGRLPFTAWDRDTFITELGKYDVCYLAYNPDGRRRCLNRLLAPASLGIPTIVNSVHSTAGDWLRAAGFWRMDVVNGASAWSAYKDLRDDDLYRDIASNLQERVWFDFAPQLYADRLAEVFRSVVQRRSV